MRRGRVMAGGVCVAALGFVVGAVVAGDHEGISEEQMMQAWMEYGTPGEQHQKMAESIGKWNIEGQMWEYAGAEPEASTMTATVEPILGGRYFVETVKGSFEMGDQQMPFEGRNLMGYDNLKDKYFYVWADTWMTGVNYGEGTASDGGKTITFYSDNAPNPVAGGFEDSKIVTKHVSQDKHVSTFYKKGEDGKWWKHMVMTYTRAM